MVLGFRLLTDTERISEINCDGRLTEIRNILNKWSKRQPTPFGKITVIKTLTISKSVHLFINIPDPPNSFLRDIEADVLKFLWDGKPSCCFLKCSLGFNLTVTLNRFLKLSIGVFLRKKNT